ncbi:hypothetical protein Ait01nite_016000 [Actinoplanes italicus]|uniref:Uncharacterized protein n=1 Tax=Actinoplanes italicus TaxID=113567 RepID=A0A2T0KHX6_9ACTN|nr:hypothetical protein [Actinoplanes italicus]PRX23036.1 hypothetical protein CLV67_104564 [Actinoplanes italicus]GIE28555.1 hypothetical protein Ait01nite_016000 [Actinoplanes italicus]
MHAESGILKRLNDGGQTPADPAHDIRESTVTTPGRNEIGRIGDLLGDAEQQKARPQRA